MMHAWSVLHRPILAGHRQPRRGATLLEALVVVLIFGLAFALVVPAILQVRESARRQQCVNNLRRIGFALQQYHDSHGSLPPAAVWDNAPVRTVMLNEIKQIDLITRENWVQLLLPHLGQTTLAEQFDRRRPVMDSVNARPRRTPLPEFSCPADSFNRQDNLYAFGEADGRPLAELSRGNYAVNGGTHNPRFTAESSARPHGDRLERDTSPGHFRLIGSGVAGINRAFRFSEFTNGRSTLVAVDEIRAGIHPLDPRGVWALGQIGGSITWAHGVAGDDGAPNHPWERGDDVQGCAALHEAVGSDTLTKECMPCVRYIDRNDQATARSRHAHGVNVLFLDGAVRPVHDRVDPGLWHVMHSRETPPDVLAGRIESLGPFAPPPDAVSLAATADIPSSTAGSTIKNSRDMEFVVVPEGEFTMGVADRGDADGPPLECPAHRVRIPRPFRLGRHEVTQGQFRSVTGSNPSHHRPETVGGENTDQFPVDQVSWHDAAAFCRKLSDLPEERAARRRYRLPTEAEWEYACREGKSEAYGWKPIRQSDDDSGANAGLDPPLPITRVGSYPPNAFGLYDMRGNVWEWCSDWFDRTYYSRSPVENPTGPASGFLKVVRGGDWIFVGENCHINYPIMPPWKAGPYTGFRVVCEEIRDSRDDQEKSGKDPK